MTKPLGFDTSKGSLICGTDSPVSNASSTTHVPCINKTSHGTTVSTVIVLIACVGLGLLPRPPKNALGVLSSIVVCFDDRTIDIMSDGTISDVRL